MSAVIERERDLPVAAVSAPDRGQRHEARAVKVVWQRDVVRFRKDKARIISSMMQPLLFLFVLGKGLAAAMPRTNGLDFTTFLFPGTLATGVMFVAVFSGISIVWDREFGFLREMLVAPISRSSIVVGKCLGGATVATFQGLILLALAGLVGVPYNPLLILGCAVMIFLVAFSITAFGLVLAVRVKTIQAVMPLVQMLLTPLMFLSGSLFPVGAKLPLWLTIATRLNPISYAVAAMRTFVLHFIHTPAGAISSFQGGLTWGSFVVPTWLDIVVVVGCGLALLGAACALFAKTE
jgi:ABC-2 type transport system permease protein